MKHLSDNNEKRITESASVADSKGITQSAVHDSDAEVNILFAFDMCHVSFRL